MKAALYYRVSTEDQTTEPQRLELLEYCSRRGWEVAREYADKISGAKWTRLGLESLMADVRARRIDAVLCVKLDRLGRSLPHLAQTIAELDRNKVALVATSQGIDTSNDNPAARLQMHVLMAVAEFERSLIRERTLAGLAVARKNGKKLGRPCHEGGEAEKATIAAFISQKRAALESGGKAPTFQSLAKSLRVSVGMAFRLAKGAA